MASRPKFYVPDWSDRVDPGFNFTEDTFTPDRAVIDDVYAHELFEELPYDGVLVSRAVAEKDKGGFRRLIEVGARKFYRLRAGMSVFGDCGAFSYVNEDKPWYEVEDVAEYYEQIGVDFGVSVDHLVVNSIQITETRREGNSRSKAEKLVRRSVPMSKSQREERVRITLDNASSFIRLHAKRRFSFEPVGVAQGWQPSVYADSALDLLKMGYKYIALGGLARSNSSQITKVLQAVTGAIADRSPANAAKDYRIHLFGVAKMDLIQSLSRYKVASIDSASYLRKAWLRSGQNYLSHTGSWYTAIRIPQSHNPRLRQDLSVNGRTLEEAEKRERRCIKLLEDFDRGAKGPPDVDLILEELLQYDQYLLREGSDGSELQNREIAMRKYRRTLEDRPWKGCPCDVCRNLGIHVVIFRGLNRNKRRGFHNTWIFHQAMRKNGFPLEISV